MKPHVKNYMEYFGYCRDDIIVSELSGKKAVDLHHCKLKSRGGGDEVENIMALTREEHENAHKGILSVEYLQQKHKEFMQNFTHYN